VDFWWRRRRRRRSGRTDENWNERRERRAFWTIPSATPAKRRGILSGSTHTVQHVAPNYRFIISLYPVTRLLCRRVSGSQLPIGSLRLLVPRYLSLWLSAPFQAPFPLRSSTLGIWFSGVSFVSPRPGPEISGCGFQLWALEPPHRKSQDLVFREWNLKSQTRSLNVGILLSGLNSEVPAQALTFMCESWGLNPGSEWSGSGFQVWTFDLKTWDRFWSPNPGFDFKVWIFDVPKCWIIFISSKI
jgi:hypothetical protein